MPVLDRDALQASPLADLHAIASELSMDGYRRLRKAELIDAILGRQSGEEKPSEEPEAGEPEEEEAPAARRRRGRRGGRGRATEKAEAPAEKGEAAAEKGDAAAEKGEARAEQDTVAVETEEKPARPEDESVEGVVELLPNGSGFVRVNPPEPSDDDVYVSAAQVKRCELVSGDRVAGPRRAPRRSERFASLVRVDTINGQPASELASGQRFEDLPAAFPSERFRLGSDDPTIKAIEFLTPFGKGSRVTVVGPSRSGKTEALRRLAAALAGQEGLQVSLALAGVRPEEIADWAQTGLTPGAAVSFAVSAETQDHTVELVVDQARRIAARGADAVVLIDTLDGLHSQAAHKALAAARNLVDGGSLTVIATATEPLGGETTVIALDLAQASTGRFPAVDLAASGTIKPELLVGEAEAEAIARERAQALGV